MGVEVSTQRSYGVSFLTGREPKLKIPAYLEARSRDAILLGQPEANIPPRDRGGATYGVLSATPTAHA